MICHRKEVRTMKKGFTLIELLIVVAIIAILAAIAVPNFLEAQVRSKVSRVKADMRSIATAIEAYAVDNNRPPMGYWSCRSTLGNIVVSGSGMLVKVTSPVAYITRFPLDPFTEKGWTAAGPLQIYVPRMTYFYETSSPQQTPGVTGIGLPGVYAGLMYNIYKSGTSWFMFSLGPSRFECGSPLRWLGGQSNRPEAAAVYDPTNGTLSWGFIYRTSGGAQEGIPAVMPVSSTPPGAW
jgi:prepilin-type N-terminal cleavage/methylation domain-containing protein